MANNAPASPPPPPSDESESGSSDFEVVDDLTASREAAAWAKTELLAGREPDSIVAELIETGWQSEEVQQIVDEVMRLTRADRGVPDYTPALRQALAYYRKSNSGWMLAMPSLAAMRRLLFSLASVRSLKRKQ